jgi:hypothetical protein
LQTQRTSDSFTVVGYAGNKHQKGNPMDYANCDKCGTEFVIKNALSSSVRCPDCSQWVDLIPQDNYASSYVSSSYADNYVDYDADNYGFMD